MRIPFLTTFVMLIVFGTPDLQAAGLKIPPAALGRKVMPKEKPLWNWQVYKKTLVINKQDFKKYPVNLKTPEAAAVGFFLDLNRRASYYSSSMKANVKAAMESKIQIEIQGQKIYRVRLLASISRADLAGKKPPGSFLEKPKVLAKVIGLIGEFDTVVFIETPAFPNDNFVFLKKEQNQYKIVGILGWPFNP